MRTRRNKRWKLAAWMVAGLWAALVAAAEPTQNERGRQLWSRDFADGQLGMLAMNVAGGKSEVVEADGRKLAKVTLQFTPRVTRHQLQFFVDQGGVDRQRGDYFLATYDYRSGETGEPSLGAELFPLGVGNVGKGPAKSVWSQITKPDPQGWRTARVVFHAADPKWDGTLLQFRLLLFRDGVQPEQRFETFFRKVELRQLTAE